MLLQGLWCFDRSAALQQPAQSEEGGDAQAQLAQGIPHAIAQQRVSSAITVGVGAGKQLASDEAPDI
ncbi:hypothetical protein RHM58_05575 [Pseudomonas sp. 10S4]|uniref:hypothetical protein n=1 Tax=Pseudomonas sp. 10S4 TaxID=3048583 RepID=UPI002AC99115|nr:hypothetical protein [Pseudomonas sp. 10S4]WPX21619.1 hypothetical protein RHM58_05575 [Pseudomonas sp. 10S4]